MARSIAGLAERQGHFFLAKRKPGGDLAHKWELPGGKLEKGETAEEAMIREWLEELEIQVQVGPLLSSGHFTHKDTLFLLEMYHVEFKGDPKALHEHVEWGWFSPEEINSLDLAGSDRIVLSEYMKEVRMDSKLS
ncbi:NUDIX domain-containing protein [Oceanispirochaeta sp.]|jgi:8-oxo-dGTP diphosphatase|uniref:(deoxy)nucleoside triphosphate pyrophosphohydrolase n=1 Tax=Oceanispirochaeta sp. TaxID=2035350 RepID=UPI0026168D52|nr:NUDIX domain-containing protein [Oceanispirochaeta sp.]MDA3957233.1 NUDIX domain-containing protein [Oceanispirochaeta sp.]